MPASSLPIVHPQARCPPSPHEWSLGTAAISKSGAMEVSRSEATKRWFGAPPSRQSRPFPRLASRGAVVSNRNHACVANVTGKNAAFNAIVHLEPLQVLLAGGLA